MSERGYLVLTLRPEEAIQAGDVEFVLIGIDRGRIKVGIRAPREVNITHGLSSRDAEQIKAQQFKAAIERRRAS